MGCQCSVCRCYWPDESKIASGPQGPRLYLYCGGCDKRIEECTCDPSLKDLARRVAGIESDLVACNMGDRAMVQNARINAIEQRLARLEAVPVADSATLEDFARRLRELEQEFTSRTWDTDTVHHVNDRLNEQRRLLIDVRSRFYDFKEWVEEKISVMGETDTPKYLHSEITRLEKTIATVAENHETLCQLLRHATARSRMQREESEE